MYSLMRAAVLVSMAGLAACGQSDNAAPAGDDVSSVDFNWDVRPILSDKCFACHGPGTQKAGLRLDVRERATSELSEDPDKYAIVPGKPEQSEMVRRISSDDPTYFMPPPESHKTLSDDERAVLKKWIASGAEYKPHWAYISPKRLEPPKTAFGNRAVNAIDRFVFAKLEVKGLSPSPEADKETLINRVTMDLTGLPPTLDEVDAFLADDSPDAYERLVDRLLNSPQYGERMATRWMDVARYSETDGFLDDLHGRLFYPWRDWVIKSYNVNMPFDQFATWQLAGDLMPDPSREQILATAFGRLGPRSNENGIIDEEYRVEYVNERAELVGKAFLGLTVGCARCHDHKYDAISAADYYSLGAYFNSIDERGFYAAAYSGRDVGPTLLWPDQQQQQELDNTRMRLKVAEADLEAARAKASSQATAQAKTLQSEGRDEAVRTVAEAFQAAQVAYLPLDEKRSASQQEIEHDVKDIRVTFMPPESKRRGPPDGPTLPNGLVPDLLEATPSGSAGGKAGFLQEAVLAPGVRGQAFVVNDTNLGFLPKGVGWYERTDDFSFDLWIKVPAGRVYDDAMVVNHRDHNVISADSGYTLNLEKNHLRFDMIHASPANMLSVVTTDAVPDGEWLHVAVTYDGSSHADGVRIYLNGAPATTETRKDKLTQTTMPTKMRGLLGGGFYGFSFGYRFRAEVFEGGMLDEIRIFDRDLTDVEIAYLHGGDKALAAVPAQAMVPLLVAQDATVRKAKAALQAAREAENDIVSKVPEIPVMGDTEEPRQAYLLKRGLYNQHGKPVEPSGLKQVFVSDRELPADRRGLAGWLFDPENPLTARVLVNRMWDMHFGRGIVETVQDFGTQGAIPTHPELLDWLAVEFVESGWDVKHMHKLMVMSATYRQSSDVTPDIRKKDPHNYLLARMLRQRLPAEMLRDNALAASGLLVDKIGGESTMPYQPDGVWESVGSRHTYPTADQIPQDEHHRRSMYTFIKRSAPQPAMTVFDFADRSVSTVDRRVSNTPLQALVLLNDTQFVEAYRVMAERILKATSVSSEQLNLVVRLATRRSPMEQEMEILARYYDAELQRYAKNPAGAEALLRVGVAAPDPTLDEVKVAALTSVVAAFMNTPDAYSIR